MSIFNSDTDVDVICRIIKTRCSKIHFIGILGSGMLPLAAMLKSMGCEVTGSDANYSSNARASLLDGITVTPHRRINVWNKDLVVYSLAIDEENTEFIAARTLAIPLISRAQLLGALMLLYRVRVGVSGSHGKSTTVAVLDKILTTAGLSITTLSGASLSDGTTYRLLGNELVLYEACEYKDSFLRMFPTHQIITGIELDHTDYFARLDDVYSSFTKCASRATDAVVINCDCPTAVGLIKAVGDKAISYGKGAGSDYKLTVGKTDNGTRHFSISKKADWRIDLETSLIGEFNLYNITAAVAMADVLGVDRESIRNGVKSFHTIDRRLSLIGELDGRKVFYDYAHHPTEITSVTEAVFDRCGEGTVVFRPHTFSRTKALWNDFIEALCKPRFTILLDIYPAREKEIDGITSAHLAKCIGKSAVRMEFCEVAQYLIDMTEGPIILMGAGDLDPVIDELRASPRFRSASSDI